MTDSQKWLWIAGLSLTGWLIYLLAPVLSPFMVAALFAYLGDPLADRLEEKGLSRTLSVTVVFTLIFLIIIIALLLLIPMIEEQLRVLFAKIPAYLDRIQKEFIPWLSAKLGLGDISLDTGDIKQWVSAYWKQAGGIAKVMLSSISSSGIAMVGWLSSLVLIPVVTFYLLRDWDILIERIHVMIPRRIETKVVTLAKESDDVLGAFIRGQLLVMLVLAIIYSIGLKFAGLEIALLIGLLAGLVSFVPYLGFIVGISAATIAVLLQPGFEVIQLVYVVIVFGVGQLLESVVLTPALVGDKIGLHPVAVIFAVMAGGQLFGFIGILLALPVAAVLLVFLRHLHSDYISSSVYDPANK